MPTGAFGGSAEVMAHFDPRQKGALAHAGTFNNNVCSMIAIHFSSKPTKRPTDITAGCQSLRPLLHIELLLDGMLVCRRGDLFVSLSMSDQQLAKAQNTLEKFVDRYKPLVEEELAA